MRASFLQLDENICQTPIRLLSSVSTSTTSSPQTTFSSPTQEFLTMAGPADSGSCAITTVVDAENDDLYVALAGDCRAVAGWQDGDGNWRCDVLTEDQMGETPREVERCVACLNCISQFLMERQNTLRASGERARHGHSRRKGTRRASADKSFWRCSVQMDKSRI